MSPNTTYRRVVLTSLCLLADLLDEHALERIVLARALQLDESHLLDETHRAVGSLAEHAERGEVVELVGLALALARVRVRVSSQG
eukprot:scaffold28086_cov49-Phaeocystis_antarctica.AAC.2